MPLFKRKSRGRSGSNRKYRGILKAAKPMVYHGLSVPVSDHLPLPIVQQIHDDAYEKPELLAAEGLIREGDRVLEMGTGLGIVSAIISRMKDGIEVRSFEANPSLIQFISQLHDMNDVSNVGVTNAMLEPSPTQDTRRFHIHKYFSEGSIFETEMSEDVIEVPVMDLNTVIADFKPNLMICDIEGAEEIVIPNAALSNLRALVLEVHPATMSRKGMKDIFDACVRAGLYPVVELSTEQVIAFERV